MTGPDEAREQELREILQEVRALRQAIDDLRHSTDVGSRLPADYAVLVRSQPTLPPTYEVAVRTQPALPPDYAVLVRGSLPFRPPTYDVLVRRADSETGQGPVLDEPPGRP
ncbi:hypothetical protein SAMN05660642_01939 [Geodermatophilus siccatus]|uniref:Uncharacterized protein n=1 Tax=Geodermatophilus siccatus TaxID=1137991 RepID=A0A1G9RI63_9ACTN|nr:hypothetical protein SAMN05660642_01939 [Geodermatophilus siccatus]